MPLHDFRCPEGHVFDKLQPSDRIRYYAKCPECGLDAEMVWLKAPLGFVQPDYSYTSPVDGRPITNKQEHLEELARNNTIVYEPGIKQDQDRNERRRMEELERSIEQTVEREVALMPAVKREKLAAELEGGLTATPERVTPPQVSYRDAK